MCFCFTLLFKVKLINTTIKLPFPLDGVLEGWSLSQLLSRSYTLSVYNGAICPSGLSFIGHSHLCRSTGEVLLSSEGLPQLRTEVQLMAALASFTFPNFSTCSTLSSEVPVHGLSVDCFDGLLPCRFQPLVFLPSCSELQRNPAGTEQTR